MAAAPSGRPASSRQGNKSAAPATGTNTAASSVALHSTYSQANNHYATTTTAPATTRAAGTTGGDQAAKPADISGRRANNNNNWTRTAAEASERRPTLNETLLANLLRGGKANRPFTCLLVAALCASVLNTLLLSFVIKSIQLNDGAFVNGKLAWNEQLAATTLSSKAKLPGKSILVQSIESVGDDQALRIEKLSRSAALGPRRQQVVDDESLLFAIDDDRLAAGSSGRQSNYMGAGATGTWAEHVSAGAGAARESGPDRDGAVLEIGAKSFALNLITTAGEQLDESGRLAPTATERLLEFSGDRQSISLNREESLRLSPAASGSLAVEGELRSPSITGSLAHNLDLQTRDGRLLCSAGRTMKLVSKSGAIRLASLDSVRLDSAPSGTLSLHSKRLLLSGGIRYLDSEPAPPTPALVQAHQEEPSGAYELIVVNGLLAAAG